MTGPTREEVEAWAAEAGPNDYYYGWEWLQRFAALAFAAGSRSSSTDGAELVPELDQIEEALTDSVRAFEASGMNPKMQNRALWSFMRLRTALLSGARSGEDARDEWRDALHTFAHDYNRYTEGDAKMPFGTLRVSLAAFLEASAKLDAAMGGNDA